MGQNAGVPSAGTLTAIRAVGVVGQGRTDGFRWNANRWWYDGLFRRRGHGGCDLCLGRCAPPPLMVECRAAFRSSAKLAVRNCLQTPKTRRGMCVPREPEIRGSVVGQDRAVDPQITADRHVGVAAQHLVTKQVEWRLGTRHIGENDVAQSEW